MQAPALWREWEVQAPKERPRRKSRAPKVAVEVTGPEYRKPATHTTRQRSNDHDLPSLFTWADQREAVKNLREASASQPTKVSRGKHLPAAVEANHEAPVARVVPKGAKVASIGGAVVGYTAKPKRAGSPHSLARQRLQEIERLIVRRHGGPCDTDEGKAYFIAALPHLIAVPCEVSGHWATEPMTWAHRWVPKLYEEVTLQWFLGMERDFTRKPRLFAADTVAGMLRVKRAEREALKLRTIGAIDHPLEARREERKAKDAAYQKQKRVEAGAKPREQSLTATEPWTVLGISRRTWERRRARDANSSAIKNREYLTTDETASATPDTPEAAAASTDTATRTAGASVASPHGLPSNDAINVGTLKGMSFRERVAVLRAL